MISLGDRVKNPISGFKGIIVVVSKWLHGCVRVGVQPETLKNGQIMEVEYFDEPEVELVKAAVFGPKRNVAKLKLASGGPKREGKKFKRSYNINDDNCGCDDDHTDTYSDDRRK